METFIFVHDQNIVLDFINVNKFSNLDNVKYVFVGNKPVDQIKDFSNVIICRDLEYNIEQFPNLTSFTGWYALCKNNLITSDHVNLFEYDINISSDLQSKINESFNEGFDVIGYIPLNIHEANYIRNMQWISTMLISLKEKYDINLHNFLNSLPHTTSISMTSNHSMTKNALYQYMDWMSPMLDEVKKSYYSGHEVERSISIFYLVKNLKYKILENNINHFQFNSHGTQAIGVDKFINNYKQLL